MVDRLVSVDSEGGPGADLGRSRYCRRINLPVHTVAHVNDRPGIILVALLQPKLPRSRTPLSIQYCFVIERVVPGLIAEQNHARRVTERQEICLLGAVIPGRKGHVGRNRPDDV